MLKEGTIGSSNFRQVLFDQKTLSRPSEVVYSSRCGLVVWLHYRHMPITLRS